MSNTTSVTALSSSLSYHPAQGNGSIQGLSADTANNLGYGVGKIVRGVFDSFWNTWQKMWTPVPSAIEIATQRKYMIYKKGLNECVEQLQAALANLQKNPKNLSELKKVSDHFASYLEPNREENLRELQSEILKPLEEKVSDLARLHMENLKNWMPVFFQTNSLMNQKVLTAPTCSPTNAPTKNPTPIPTRTPTSVPTCIPFSTPTLTPTDSPTSVPTDEPTTTPTNSPTGTPTEGPTTAPTFTPTNSPTGIPTDEPTTAPTSSPIGIPTEGPTTAPTFTPTNSPTGIPTDEPTTAPTNSPIGIPTEGPTTAPTNSSTGTPTDEPTSTPTSAPTAGVKNTALFAVLGCIVGLLTIVVGIGIYRFKKEEKEKKRPGKLLINTGD